MTLASAYLTYHDFSHALQHEQQAWREQPSNVNALAQIASLQMELGRYAAAAHTLQRIPRDASPSPTVNAVRARYDELTGNLTEARTFIATAIRLVDSSIDTPAIDRSWFHLRAAQLAWEAGDTKQAQAECAVSLQDYPNNASTLMFAARIARSQRDWHRTLDMATRSADLYPLPQVLGYKADAQRALGDLTGAAATDALIVAEERIFNAQGTNDRLLADYYAQRGIRLEEAQRAAESDVLKRGNEIYADDTLGWVLAKRGRWNIARRYAESAIRLGTQDAQVQYHAAIIALHTGHTAEAKRRLKMALTENAQFDPFDVEDARRVLAE